MWCAEGRSCPGGAVGVEGVGAGRVDVLEQRWGQAGELITTSEIECISPLAHQHIHLSAYSEITV